MNKPAVCWSLAVALALGVATLPAVQAEEPVTVPGLVEQLKPKPRSRGIKFVEPEPPKVDLSIQFELNSAKLTPAGLAVVDSLGGALASTDLGEFRFQIAGHTDASGSARHNKALSLKRAASVKKALMERYGIDAARLVEVGYGPDRLLLPEQPKDAKNRRVEIVNLGVLDAAAAP